MDFYRYLRDACIEGNLERVKFVSSHEMSWYRGDSFGMTPFAFACQHGHLDIVQWLMPFVNPTSLNVDGLSPLDLACSHGCIDIVQWLYPLLDPSHRSSCLHAAVQGKRVDIVQWLIDQHHPLITNHEQDTPLHIACRVNSLECVQLLRSYGLDERNSDRQTPFLLACQFGRLPLAQYLYTQGVNIHHHNIYHENAFHLACESGNLPLAQWIHSLRIDPVTDIYGDSALAYAAKFGHTHMIPWLCQHLPVNHTSNVGHTPFLQACREGHLMTAKKLYEHGADIRLTDSLGRSPLFHAVNGDHLDLVEWLGSFGIVYEERLLRTTPDYLMDPLFLLGACHVSTTMYTTPFMKQLYRSHTWVRLRKRMKRHYDQRILLLGKNKTDFDSWMETLPWCSDISFLIGEFVGILRFPQWDRVLTIR
jgi:ankyrin repeat protein